jgi:hypothetical protein
MPVFVGGALGGADLLDDEEAFTDGLLARRRSTVRYGNANVEVEVDKAAREHEARSEGGGARSAIEASPLRVVRYGDDASACVRAY